VNADGSPAAIFDEEYEVLILLAELEERDEIVDL